ncbi:MAG TPA: NAD(P)-dependent oxidoreductase [bacterium]|nr:NAD(P)-dependent oxidoreductase [bacterium]
MKIFLTGGSGFIGHWVVKQYLEEGHQLRLLVRNPKKIPSLKNMANVEILEGGLYDKPVLVNGLKGVDACVHIALGWGETPTTMLEKDTAVTAFLMEEAEKTGVKQFLYTSSTAAVGEFRPHMTESIDVRPMDLYGATKASSEAYLLGFGAKVKMRCNIIRPGYTFGNPAFSDGVTQPDQRFNQIAAAAKKGQPITVTKYDGTQFIWAGDLAKLYSAVLNSNHNRRIFFGLSTEFVTWEAVAKKATELAGSKSKIAVEDKGWDPKPMLFDMGLIKKEFGLEFVALPEIAKHLEYLIAKA